MSLFVEPAKKSTVAFDTDSESDSIQTDSTAKSELRDEYEVEKILMEQDGLYLVKWEGYKLCRSTWEPRESLVGEETLAEWERQKQRIAAGQAKPFDFDEYMTAYSKAEAERKDKRRRRNAKRQKRGLPIRTYTPSEDSDADDEDLDDGEIPHEAERANDQSMPIASSKRQASSYKSPRVTKRSKQLEVTRKGVAKKITRNRVVSDTSSSDDGSSSDQTRSSSVDSLREELVARATDLGTRTRKAAKSRQESAQTRKPVATSSIKETGPTEAPQRASTITTNLKEATAVEKVNVINQVPHKTGPSGAARKSAPSHVAAGPARKPHDILANWSAPKQRRERQRVSGATPKDSTDPKFTALSIQSRYQKYGRENEKPPDFNALTVIDPKTGKTIPPRATVQDVPAKESSSAYRRRTPPPQERRRSSTPPPVQVPAASRDSARNHAAINVKPICSRWLTKGCPKAADKCDFVHPVSKNIIDHSVDKKNVTCWYWLSKHACAFGSTCQFAHVDTRIYSSPPSSGQGYFTVNLPRADVSLPPPQPQIVQSPPRPTSVSAQPVVRPPGEPACREWLEGTCSKSAERCTWAHALPTEPYRGDFNTIPKSQVLCYYWAKGGSCNRGRSCAFSHVDTGIQAGPPGSGSSGRISIVPKTSEYRPSEPSEPISHARQTTYVAPDPSENSRRDGSVSKADAITRNLPPRGLTCFFWRTRGQCAKPDKMCEYAHFDTGVWAAPPPGFNHSREDTQHPSGNANMIPIAANRGLSLHTHVDSALIDAQGLSSQSPRELVGSPLQLQAPPMAPPGREDVLQRQSISTPAGSMATTLTIYYTDDHQPTPLQTKLELSELHIFGKLAGADPQLNVDRVVLASDFKTIVWDDYMRRSESTVGSIVVSNAAAGQSLVELCKQHTIGLIATQPGKKSRMLIYPPSDDVWKFLDIGSNWKTDSALRFHLFSEVPGIEDIALSGTSALVNPSRKRPPPVIAGEELVKLDSARLLPVSGKSSHGARAAFLMFPPGHHVELEFYAKFLGAQNYRVYHSGAAGAWQYFCKTNDRKVVIVHPDVPIWQVPDLKHLLWSGTSIFSVGLNHLDPMEDALFGCERLFPHATAVLITDDVFIYHPGKALEVLNGFLKSMKGRLEYKIVTRPGVKQWLLHLAEGSFTERGRQDNQWMSLYDAICRLCPPEDEDPYDPPNPRADTQLVSLSPEVFPKYEEMWESNEAAATGFLVEWFAGWTIENITRLRKLYVLYEPKSGFHSILDAAGKWPAEDSHGWVERYQHIWFQRPEDIFAAKK